MANTPRRSLELTQGQWESLEGLALATASIPSRGPNTTNPSWRNLLSRVANSPRCLEAIEAVLNGQATKNTLVIIGFMSGKRAYLNMSKEDAVKKYLLDNPGDDDIVNEPGFVEEFQFDNEFDVYDASRGEQ